ncbi:DUF1788 domain-containing protein [Schleiferilactobacillus harbinensis]|uniref:ATP-binding protein n=1 Tax=Schleiferilactobacillus harbinensis DSM 16991 TaxID=1122147 RepID=A0A0R1XBA4_9LACO|nr:DUF1788 domain-containing protein [Schleiferilactobacillus harbinensis]KRM27482.1 hypothetical protein FC91_GL002494 [Schleiferilactobacillus harbinensis DSM 16991]QFR63416.1 DUF1788 domain-containing protein [Schleiferilactobacillus harbinensis]
MVPLKKKFQDLREKIQSQSFQENRGLSNEVGYYIFDYDPEKELYVRGEIGDIVRQAKAAPTGATIQVFNLYTIMLSIIDKFGYREGFIDLEKSDGITQVIDWMNNIMEMNEEHNLVVQYISDHLNKDGPTIVFITGVGQVYPIIRAHKVLNTMTQVIDQIPVMMFYPGNYNSVRLQAFGELQEDNYYRAFHFE